MFKKFLEDTSGHFAIMFAICAMVLAVGAGMAIETTNMVKEKSRLQNVADNAVLAAALTKEKTVSGKMREAVIASIAANNPNGLTINHTVSIKNDVISVNADIKYDGLFTSLLGSGGTLVAATSESPIGVDIPINIALVLDRTGSMAGANMTSLKDASGSLVDIFSSFEGETKVGVVPFSNYVNVGVANRNQSWMDVPDDTSTARPEYCYMRKDVISRTNCVTTQKTCTRTNDGVSTSYACSSTTCDYTYGPEYEYCYTPSPTVSEWNGCVGSRLDGHHNYPDYRNKQFPGLMNEDCGESILPLTTNMQDVKDKINSLTTTESTYIPAGLMWGWRLLDSKKPFDDLSNEEARRKRAIVLMTDGSNTMDLTAPTHSDAGVGVTPVATNTLMTEICDGIKGENIDIYTVAYKLTVADAATKDRVKACASSNAQFFDAQSASDLKAAFENIGNSLFTVRLSG